ncbi:MAG: InlB B-repeat-containing protein, partial [Butyrivibrio sp.]|nr:InlB B-repeat-containing protein [Butyrivibrio sp.]
YKQNVDDDEYTVDSSATENLTGKTDQIAAVTVKAFAGFSVSKIKTTEYVSRKDGKDTASDNDNKIRGDGTLVIKLYYDRETYTVSYSYDNTLPIDAEVNPTRDVLATKGGSYRYGALVPIEADAEATGYTFTGWNYSSWQEVETVSDAKVGLFARLEAFFNRSKAAQKYFEMPAGNVELIGTFTANTNTKYTVAHYLETAETGKYELGSVEKIGGGIVKNPEEKTGTTAAVPQNYVRTIDGYKHNTAVKADEFFGGVGDKQTKLEPKDVKILADGSLLINVYYQHDAEKVEFYVLKPGQPIPEDGLPRDSANYYPYNAKATAANWVGSAKLASGQTFPVYDTNPDRSANLVEADIISRPSGVINTDTTLSNLYPGVTEANIVWYVFKKEGSVAHIDGYIRGQSISVIYNKNDGTETPATWKDDEAKTGEYTLLGKDNTNVKPLMEREGYTFEGWSLKADAVPGTADVLKPGSEVVVMTSGTTFYAVWSVNQYTVKYEYDKVPTGVELPALPNNGEEVSYDYGEEVTVADPVTAPAGYYFTGWKAETEAGVETVTAVDGKFDMPADNVIIKGSFAEKLKVTIVLKTPGENTDRLYNGQVQEVNTDIGVAVEGGDDPDLAEYIKEQVSSAGLQALNNIRDFFVITAYAYDDSLDLGEDPEITESGITVGGYTVTAPIGIDANKDREGTADADKKLVGHEKDYPIVFNGSDMTITKDGADLREVADITVVDADGNEITDLSGNITIGYLTIVPREVTLTSGSASRVANGTALTSPEVAISGEGFVAALKDGETGDEIDEETLKTKGAIGTITDPGSVENKIDDIANFKTDFFRKDTNYIIKEVLGTLTVSAPTPTPGPSDDDTPSDPGTPTTTIPDAPVATAPAPTGAVLGAQRDVPVDGPAVLGARRAGTDDSTNRTARAFVILVSAAVALTLMITGKKKREN